MNIRVKVISLLALLFAALIGIEIGVQRQILMPSFAELEREDAEGVDEAHRVSRSTNRSTRSR